MWNYANTLIIIFKRCLVVQEKVRLRFTKRQEHENFKEKNINIKICKHKYEDVQISDVKFTLLIKV